MIKLRTVVVLVAVQLALFVAAPAVAQEMSEADCSLTSSGAIPLTDLGTDTYQGEQGGLYPGGSNQIPADHETLGLWRASQIEPRNAAGEPDPDGAIVVLSIGVSNTRIEFAEFTRSFNKTVETEVTLINGAQSGADISSWQDIEDHPWRHIGNKLGNNGFTPEQVQAVWIMLPDVVDNPDEILPFPADSLVYRDQLAVVVRNAMDMFPNLQVAYLSSREYGGYSTNGRPSPEPLAYENGFGVKWLIEDQIDGDMNLNADARRGPVEAPWLAWGPYLWADGLNPRGDGLVWECADFRIDGTHPSSEGADKVATMLKDFFLETPTSAPWFSVAGEPIGDVELPPVVEAPATTTTVPETTTTTSAAPQTTTTAGTARSERPGQRDRSALEERRAERIEEREAEADSDIEWLVGTVAVLALVLGVIALVGKSRNRHRQSGVVATDDTHSLSP